MSYNPDRQYRCPIIRGKGQREIEDVLPLYAKILSTICPCPKNDFPKLFNTKLRRIFNMATDKTLNNHRTEIAGKLFGMYYLENQQVEVSERTKKLLEDSDFPSFFKDICFKLQFPSGNEKSDTILDRISHEIRLRPFVFVLQACNHAENERRNKLTRQELGYYALNSLEVLQGKVSPATLVDKILDDRRAGKTRYLQSGSYHRQHIIEIFNYLELANLIEVNNDVITINSREADSLSRFYESDYSALLFDVYDYEFDDPDERKKFYLDWLKHYGELSHKKWTVFETDVAALNAGHVAFDGVTGVDTQQIGDDGERLVFLYEKKRISQINGRWADKVKIVGGTRGLGYDVLSVQGKGAKPAHSVHIEVKSTKRTTIPQNIDDSVNLTRNEWLAAEQYKDSYWIYRVYLTRAGAFVHKIINVVGENGTSVFCEPVTYRLDFKSTSSLLEKIG